MLIANAQNTRTKYKLHHIRDRGNMKTMAPIAMLQLHFPQAAALPGPCTVQGSGRRRRAVGPCLLLWQKP